MVIISWSSLRRWLGQKTITYRQGFSGRSALCSNYSVQNTVVPVIWFGFSIKKREVRKEGQGRSEEGGGRREEWGSRREERGERKEEEGGRREEGGGRTIGPMDTHTHTVFEPCTSEMNLAHLHETNKMTHCSIALLDDFSADRDAYCY